MISTATALVRFSIAAAVGGAALFWNGNLPRQAQLVSAAAASAVVVEDADAEPAATVVVTPVCRRALVNGRYVKVCR